MGNYVIAVGNYLIVSPSELGNYKIADTAFPARSPLLPARTCSRRAASVFPTSPPQQDKRARSGTLQLCYCE